MESASDHCFSQATKIMQKSKKRGSQFLRGLFNFLEENPFSDIISWDEEGLKIEIKDASKLAENVLPKLYKYTNLENFFKQLERYKFQRCDIKDKPMIVYHHKLFQRRRSDLLERISKMPVITKVKISDSSDTSSSRKRVFKASSALETQMHNSLAVFQNTDHMAEGNERPKPPEGDSANNSDTSHRQDRIGVIALAERMSDALSFIPLNIDDITSVLTSITNQIYSSLVNQFP